MAHYPQSATGLNYISYPAGPTAAGMTVTTGGSANTKGSYAEFVASSPFACNAVVFRLVRTNNNSGRAVLVDLATGAAASETMILPNLPSDTSPITSYAAAAWERFPVAIASGTRIASRAQISVGTNIDFRVSLTLIAAGDTVGVSGAWTSYGISTITSAVTSVNPGAVADTKGSYAEIASSTSAVIQAMVIAASTVGNAATTVTEWLVDLATGAAAAEVVLIPDLNYGTGTSTSDPLSFGPRWLAFLTYIASSTRIAARASCAITDATDRVIGIGLVAATAPTESGGGSGGTVAYAHFG